MALGKGWLLVGLVGALAAAPVQGAVPAASPQEALKAIQATAKGDDCKSTLAAIGEQIPGRGFAALPGAARARFYHLAAYCALQLGQIDLGYRYALDGTKIEEAAGEFWQMRFGIETRHDRLEPAVATLEAMAIRHPDNLNAIPIRSYYELSRKLRDKPDQAARRRLLKVLSSPTYQPDEITATGDNFRQDYAALLAEGGDKAGATALVSQIKEPSTLIEISLDPRLRAFIPSDFDARAAVESDLARIRDVAASHPGSLDAALLIARRLRQLGRAEEALATLEAVRPTGPQAKNFTDLDEQLNWWWDAMAHVYAMLGRPQEAFTAFRGGMAAKEYGGGNVSQTINLAEVQLRFGLAEDALATLRAFDGGKLNLSPYGEMAMRSNRGCAYARAGRMTELKSDLAFAIAHERDAPGALGDLLLCSGDMDGAAASFVRRLDDPERRASALLALSDFDAPPVPLPPDPIANRLAELKTRPDIKAAIARAGGTRRFALQSSAL